MASELALHAYVFLGNALNLVANGAGAPQRSELGTSPAALHDLHAKVEPLTPGNILAGVTALPPGQRALLLRVCLWCVHTLGPEFDAMAGVTPAAAQEVLAWLEQDIGGA